MARLPVCRLVCIAAAITAAVLAACALVGCTTTSIDRHSETTTTPGGLKTTKANTAIRHTSVDGDKLVEDGGAVLQAGVHISKELMYWGLGLAVGSPTVGTGLIGYLVKRGKDNERKAADAAWDESHRTTLGLLAVPQRGTGS